MEEMKLFIGDRKVKDDFQSFTRECGRIVCSDLCLVKGKCSVLDHA